eukprot:c15677_g1_i1.p1 GENE.c15677_g1_i1~~c15677_g1_i1.p1  ORF type:complete len:417 (+),score=33.94 c15677_g1_i1:130-1380(+)
MERNFHTSGKKCLIPSQGAEMKTPSCFWHWSAHNVRALTAIAIVGSIAIYLLVSITSGSINLRFDDNCRASPFDGAVCQTANIAAWLAGSIWYACVLSQIIKDALITRCAGLSIIWAWLNFTAATANAFAVFAFDMPLFSRVMSVYMPALNAAVLGQLFYFRVLLCEDRHGDVTFPIRWWVTCSAIWIAIVLCGFLLRAGRESLLDLYSWTAIAMWSIEGFFQIAVNFRRGTCDGQSYPALALTALGKSMDISVQWLLLMPGRYLLLAYCSSACGFLNVLQALWYADRKTWWKQFLIIIATTYLIAMLYGFLSYVLILAPFESQLHSEWIRTDHVRWYFVPFPFVVSTIAMSGWFRRRHAQQTTNCQKLNFLDLTSNHVREKSADPIRQRFSLKNNSPDEEQVHLNDNQWCEDAFK